MQPIMRKHLYRKRDIVNGYTILALERRMSAVAGKAGEEELIYVVKDELGGVHRVSEEAIGRIVEAIREANKDELPSKDSRKHH